MLAKHWVHSHCFRAHQAHVVCPGGVEQRPRFIGSVPLLAHVRCFYIPTQPPADGRAVNGFKSFTARRPPLIDLDKLCNIGLSH